ncbi:lytic transglycosylase domain-containing protein [Desulfosarcina cetonica]|uniref:lytic transglycosylase domain-containing protein n=1 Tax=Desulfosarcina cetonica TaxID=90730 RepID=UPI001C4480B6|nr:lytic transglycosylase domain-containing protein [Desulfosarcina cetonica]
MLKDLAVFVTTIALCTFFLTVSVTFSNYSPSRLHASLVRAEQQPSVRPEQVPSPEVGPQDQRFAAAPTDATQKPTAPVKKSRPESHLPFHRIVAQVAGRYEIDPSLIQAIIFAESGYNPKAKSKKGARGLMQLMPSTAKAFGVRDIYDPKQNIEGGVRYFKYLLDRYNGDVQLALAAYNAGSRHVEVYAGVPPFKTTQRYIKKVLKFHKKFKREKLPEQRRLA